MQNLDIVLVGMEATPLRATNALIDLLYVYTKHKLIDKNIHVPCSKHELNMYF